MWTWILSIGVCVALYSVLFKKKKQIDEQLESLVGKNVIITGANTGIGKSTAVGLAKKGARVIIACRSREKAEAAVKEIITLSNNQNVEFMQLDLCSTDSIRKFVKEFLARNIPCHILVNNAGVLYFHSKLIGDSPVMTKDGWNVQFMANYLGHFLLTNLLLDHIKQNNTRVVNVTSSMHFFATLDFSDLQGNNCSLVMGYCRSKLAQIYFTYYLEKMFRQIPNCSATCNCVHPGYIATDIVRNLGSAINWLFHLVWNKVLGWDTEDGASGPLKVSGTTLKGGQYFSKTSAASSSSVSYDAKIGQQLWRESLRLVGLPVDETELSHNS